MKNLKYIAILSLGLLACESEIENSINDGGVYTAGDADFSTFVAVGNSLTAGFADGALYLDGQRDSYPNILAEQFQFVGGGEFTQPLVSDNLGGLTLSGAVISPNRLVLTDTGSGVAPLPLAGEPTTDITNALTGSFNNMGVPGAKSFHLVAPGYGDIGGVALGTANPYYARFASSPTATMLGDATAQNPTFFALWIGNNDVLSFATSGGVGVDQTGNLDPTTYGSNDITDPNVFAATYSSLVDGLTANGAKGVVCNLPDVTAIPYFTTVPYNAIPMDAATAAGTNAAYVAYNGGLAAANGGGFISAAELAQRTINFVAGQNALVIEDESLTDLSALGLPSIRMATANDFILLPTLSVIGTLADPANPASVIGVGVALNDSQVLTENEAVMVATAQAQYNATISALAAANDGVEFVNMQSHLNQLNGSGIPYDGGVVTSTFASGGGFSLDGVHPTARGYALIANIIIETINDKFNATVPEVNPGHYSSVYVN